MAEFLSTRCTNCNGIINPLNQSIKEGICTRCLLALEGPLGVVSMHGGYLAVERHRKDLARGKTNERNFDMIVESIPHLLGYNGEGTVEEAHALADIQAKLSCDEEEARLFLMAAIRKFPGLGITEIDAKRLIETAVITADEEMRERSKVMATGFESGIRGMRKRVVEKIIKPAFEKLIEEGILPKPKGPVVVGWGDSDDEIRKIAKERLKEWTAIDVSAAAEKIQLITVPSLVISLTGSYMHGTATPSQVIDKLRDFISIVPQCKEARIEYMFRDATDPLAPQPPDSYIEKTEIIKEPEPDTEIFVEKSHAEKLCDVAIELYRALKFMWANPAEVHIRPLNEVLIDFDIAVANFVELQVPDWSDYDSQVE